MIYCNECVGEHGACCEFCKFYDFNGDGDVYVGDGYCNLCQEHKDPENVCGSFHCNKAIMLS